ncbi:MAG: sigma-54-dependent Fis family transcriptional regulator [Acidobacteria bacterium]|nr:sigma-54-dependent Fis family transcriptional regulator [Acidobacteriota bacterium]MCW5967105.1 sigma-54-dependent Fis family transcriptional regulator [Blastocatellales bacterium]
MINEAASTRAIEPRPSLTLVESNPLSADRYESLLGVSANIAGLREFIAVQSTHTQASLLIGERGLRQEQAARAIHESGSGRRDPFFAVNAHSIGGDSLDSLLFGSHGVIESIRRGTIFVNELTGLPILLQQRFAAYLEERRWHARGGRYDGQRLVFATSFNPAERTAENRVAFGLVELLRPNSYTIKPLRERSEDLPYITSFLLERLARRVGRGNCEITPEAMKLVAEYSWENNLDELESVLEGALRVLPPPRIDEEQLPVRIRHARLRTIPAEGVDLPGIVDDFERQLIETALIQSQGSQTRASRLLGLRVQTLNMKLKRYEEQGRSLRHALAE